MFKQSKIDHNQLSQNIVYIFIYLIKIVVSRQLVFSVSRSQKTRKVIILHCKQSTYYQCSI